MKRHHQQQAIAEYVQFHARDLIKQAQAIGMTDLLVYTLEQYGTTESASATLRSSTADAAFFAVVVRTHGGPGSVTDVASWFFATSFTDGSCLLSSSRHQPFVLSPTSQFQICPNRSVAEVAERHRERLMRSATPARPIRDDLELEAFALEHERKSYQAMMDRQMLIPVGDEELARLKTMTEARASQPAPPPSAATTGVPKPFGIEFVFWIMLGIGGLMSFRGPGNQAQTIFRFAILGIAIVGILVCQIVKMSRRSATPK